MSDLEAAKAATREQARRRGRLRDLEEALAASALEAPKAVQAAIGISSAFESPAFEATARNDAPTLRGAADAFLSAAATIDSFLKEVSPPGE